MNLRVFYESPLQQPGLTGLIGLIAGGAAALAAMRAQKTFLSRWTLLFALEALLDGWLTGASSPLDPRGAGATAAAIVFVVLGDLRLYLLLARYTRRAWGPAVFAEAFAWAFAPSLVIAALKRLAPWAVSNNRHIFLIYELCALPLLMLWLQGFVPRRLSRPEDAAERAWLSGATAFFAAQYTLWVLADVAILQRASWGWGLRVVPNVMYYGLFVAFAWRSAPPGLKG